MLPCANHYGFNYFWSSTHILLPELNRKFQLKSNDNVLFSSNCKNL